jgi:hypothetical protein
MATVGALPKDPVAVTDEFEVEEDEDEDDDDDALDFDEPQPARTTQASKGIAMSARKRRMKTSMWSMSASPAYWPDRAAGPTLRGLTANFQASGDAGSHARDELLDPFVH